MYWPIQSLWLWQASNLLKEQGNGELGLYEQSIEAKGPTLIGKDCIGSYGHQLF